MTASKSLVLLRNSFLYTSALLTFFVVTVGILLTNSEIKYIGELILIALSCAVISQLAKILVESKLLNKIEFKRKKRGVTYNK